MRIGDLDGYMRTQPTEQFDVLASDENAASVASVDAESFQRLHRLLSQFYRVLVVDTGNNMRASNWRAAVDSADQLVVVTTIREDTAQSAAWALDALRAMGHEEAVRKAVTVLSAPDPKVDKALELARYLLGRLRAGWNESGLWSPRATSQGDAAEVEALEDELYFRLRGIQRATLLAAGKLPIEEQARLEDLCESLATG